MAGTATPAACSSWAKSTKAERLIDVTYEAMMRGIAAIRPGHTSATSATPSRPRRAPALLVVRDFCGHGIGRNFHDRPTSCISAAPAKAPKLKPGMFFTVEPMVNLGRPEVKILDDGWTAVTRDRSLSAQFEHMIGVTEPGRRSSPSPPWGGRGISVSGRMG
jgi:methionyl aminopeptidase